MTGDRVALYGAGGMAREVAWLVNACAPTHASRVVCMIDDDVKTHGRIVNGFPVMGLAEARRRFPEAALVAAVGSPVVREAMVQRAGAMGFKFTTLIDSRATISELVEVGEGTVVGAGTVITVNVKLGLHVQINIGCTVSHDVILDDYATLAPGVTLAGRVHLQRGAYVGAGATIINGTVDAPLTVGPRATVGAGACVLRSVPEGVTVVGVPAKPMRRGGR